MIEAFTQFGVAGLMGALWVWERTHSRRRERQLSQAHERLMHCDLHVRTLVKIVRKNTRALVEFEQTQRHLAAVLEAIGHALPSDSSTNRTRNDG